MVRSTYARQAQKDTEVLHFSLPSQSISSPEKTGSTRNRFMITMTTIGAERNAWGYLMDTVSTEHKLDRASSKADYYMTNGTPPGRWHGVGAAALGLRPDEQVRKEDLEKLFGEGTHPLTGAQLGKKFVTRQAAEQAAAEGKQFGKKPPQQSVAGFEFVFSPPKSVSSWWALADPDLKSQIRDAHQAAIDATITKLETDIIRTRTGTDGVMQQQVRGITAALFDHWDSREGDPQLHTHMLVSNRVQGEEGRWRTIDSRWSLFPAVATASEYYDSVLMDELSQRFGVDWSTQEVLENPAKYQEWLTSEQRADTPAARHQFAIDNGKRSGSVSWQIASIPHSLNQEFSTRSKKINAETDRQVAEYVRRYGKRPSNEQIIGFRQTATLSTRTEKKGISLRALTDSWRTRATKHVGDSFLFADRVQSAALLRRKELPLWSFRHDDVDNTAVVDAAEYVLKALAVARSTWGRRNAETEALRAITGWRFRSPEDRDAAVKRVVQVVLSQAVPLTPRIPLSTPTRFKTADGESMFHPQTRDLFTTQEVWDAEVCFVNLK